jgi:hypothetical protein
MHPIDGNDPDNLPPIPTEATEAVSGPATVSAQAPRCQNCDAILYGRYCANCGQSATVHVPSMGELVHDVLEGLTHSDSRVWSTLLSLWFKPGKLTEEFFAGRRMAFLPPFRLYLVISIFFFLAISFSHGTQEEIMNTHNAAATASDAIPSSCDEDVTSLFGSTLNPFWSQRIKRACTEIQRDNGKNLQEVLFATLPKAMFVFLPLVALAHMLLYWRPRRRYAEHLVFFLHLQAFFFSVGIVMILVRAPAHLWPALESGSDILRTLLGLTLPVYTLMAMRQVFKNRWPLTVLKAAVLAIAYLTVSVLTWLAVFVYAALQL